MAELVGVLNTSHTPFCYMPVSRWEEIRAGRAAYRSDVPVDSNEENERKHARIEHGFAALRQRLTELRPDVLVVFGDDQEEIFDFNNHPALAVYVGDEYSGRVTTGDSVQRPSSWGGTYEFATVKNNRDLAVGLLTGLLDRGFDPAFSVELPKRDRGMPHAIMRPLQSLCDFAVPAVPILINAYYAPQVPAVRCVEIGRAVADIIAEHPEPLRVVVVGSGGLWHTPARPESYIDEEFDHAFLEHLKAGRVREWAERFDAYEIPAGDKSQDLTKAGPGVTGLPLSGGPQGGTRETSNWIAAAATVEGRPFHVVDYIPVYASPVGISFAYSE